MQFFRRSVFFARKNVRGETSFQQLPPSPCLSKKPLRSAAKWFLRIDKVTAVTLLTKRIPKKNSKYVRDGMIELLQNIPSIRLKSITPDRGMEFTLHAEITAALNGIPFFFPRPHAPWERGTNENTNGLIREYCPKSVDMDSFDAAYFIAFTNEINLRPRKCLGWKSPYEVFFHSSLHLT